MITPLNAQIDILGAWRIGLFIGVLSCFMWILKHYAREIGWPAAALWGWIAFRALYIVEFPWLPYGDYNTAFMATAGQTMIEAVVIPIAILKAPRWIWHVLTGYLVATHLVVVFGKSLLTPWDFPSPSFDTALLALYLPFAPLWLAAASLVAIVVTHGSTAILIILAQALGLALYFSARWPWRRQVFVWSGFLLLVAGGVGIAYANSHHELFDGSHRIYMWKKYMSFWFYNQPIPGPHQYTWATRINWMNVLFGLGPGSFMWFAALIDNWEYSSFEMHSEIFQIPFELGLVGALFAYWSYGRALRLAWNDLRLRCAVLGILPFCATYHPLRYFPTMLLVGLYMREAMLRKEKARVSPGLSSDITAIGHL